MDSKDISLIVIGLDAASQLKRLLDSKFYLEASSFFREVIYVDSGSSDDSVSLMRNAGAIVFQISTLSKKSASAGRRVGAENSTGEYLLFLDSDMVPQFTVMELCDAIKSMDQSRFSGIVGTTLDVYPDGRTRTRKRSTYANVAKSFGGFVMLRRQVLLQAGSWTENLDANEELELHARILRDGWNIEFHPTLVVFHYTVVPSAAYELASIYWPLRPNRYGAFGRVIKESIKKRSFSSLLSLAPEPFVFIAMISAVALLESASISILCFSCFIVWITRIRSLRYNLVIPGIVLSSLITMFQKTPSRNLLYERK